MDRSYSGQIPNPWLTDSRRKVFISYHEGDRAEVEKFIKAFGPSGHNVFIPKALGLFGQGDFVNSTDTEYIMSRIRSQYLADSTVTIVLLGNCTHSRRYVDWELKASLRQGTGESPNGVIGIILPSRGINVHLPARFQENWDQNHANCYTRLHAYPATPAALRASIEDAYAGRTSRAHLIANSKDRMLNNGKCQVHNRVCNTESPASAANSSYLAAIQSLAQNPAPPASASLLSALYSTPAPPPDPTGYGWLLQSLTPKPVPYSSAVEALLRVLRNHPPK